MSLLLVGDFSGRGARGLVERGLAERPLLRIDADKFDQVLARVSPRLVLAAPADDRAPDTLTLRSLEDFHPDQLAGKLEAFAGFRLLRARLLDAKTFAETAAALEPATPPAPASAASATEPSPLERLLGGRPAQAKPAEEGGDMGAFLRQVVAPHLTPAPDARQPRLVAAVDDAASQHLRGLLHHPAFRHLEATWRAVHRLVASGEAEGLTVTLLDVTRDELAADLAGDPAGSDLQRRLADPAAPWSMLVLAETFGASPADVALLSALAAVGAQAGAPVVAAADPRLDWSALSDEDSARWQALRGGPNASWLGLALPRWLARLPYGTKTDPIEGWPFEELVGPRAHESYLWANPAFACALLAAAAFRERGADMELGDVLELDDLPCHTFREDGETHMQPCAEVFMPERVSSALLGRGLMPLVSARDRNALRLVRFQSIAEPPTPLGG
jgi:predicted component of type VI protein secretion system